MKIPQRIFLHITCWLLIFGYLYGAALIAGIGFKQSLFIISTNFIQLVEFYICYLWVFPKFMDSRKAIELTGGISFAIVLFISLRYLIEETLFPNWLGLHSANQGTTAWLYLIENAYHSIAFIVIAAAVYRLEQYFKTAQEQEKLKAIAVSAELSLLKSKINPSFLCDTLNYIYVLAIPLSDQLSAAILRLREMMNYAFSEAPGGRVSLDKEARYLQCYIELFRMRFEGDFYVDFLCQGVGEQKIAPLVLIPFVEKAIKYGIVNDAAQPIRIKLKIQQKRLSFEVSNKISHSKNANVSGLGLKDIRSRINLLYHDKHDLWVSNNGNTYKTTLIIHL